MGVNATSHVGPSTGKKLKKDTHGTQACYQISRCRCALCVQANSDYMREWFAKNPGKQTEYDRRAEKKRWENPEARRKADREYYAKIKDKVRAKRLANLEEARRKEREYDREYRKNNPDKVRAADRKRYANRTPEQVERDQATMRAHY